MATSHAQNIVSENLASTQDRVDVTDRKVTQVLTAVAQTEKKNHNAFAAS